MRRFAVPALALVLAASAHAGPPKDAAAWAKPQIAQVVKAGFLADGGADFHGDQPLDQQALQDVVQGLNARFLAQSTAEGAPPWAPSKWTAAEPAEPVTVADFDRVLVNALGLAGAAKQIRAELQRVGVKPPTRVGTETIARLLGLRINPPAAQDDLELLPDQPITRAEAAYSVAQVLDYDLERHD